MTAAADHFGVGPHQNVGDVAHAEPLLDAGHAGKNLLGHDGRVGDAFDFAQADVAGPAVGLLVGLVEMFRKELVPAGGHAGEALHLPQVLHLGGNDLRRFLGLLGTLAQQRFPAHHVARRIQQHALGLQAVAPARPVSCW